MFLLTLKPRFLANGRLVCDFRAQTNSGGTLRLSFVLCREIMAWTCAGSTPPDLYAPLESRLAAQGRARMLQDDWRRDLRRHFRRLHPGRGTKGRRTLLLSQPKPKARQPVIAHHRSLPPLAQGLCAVLLLRELLGRAQGDYLGSRHRARDPHQNSRSERHLHWLLLCSGGRFLLLFLDVNILVCRSLYSNTPVDLVMPHKKVGASTFKS
jgi:hypothetical protein